MSNRYRVFMMVTASAVLDVHRDNEDQACTDAREMVQDELEDALHDVCTGAYRDLKSDQPLKYIIELFPGEEGVQVTDVSLETDDES